MAYFEPGAHEDGATHQHGSHCYWDCRDCAWHCEPEPTQPVEPALVTR